MSPEESNPQELIQAAALSPAFLGAYQSAPHSITVGDKTYERDAARNTSEQIWFLAACAMQNPRAVYLVGCQGSNEMALAWDQTQVNGDSRVVAAQAAITDATAALGKAKTEASLAQSNFDLAQKQATRADQQVTAAAHEVATREQQGRTAFNDIGDFMATVGTAGLFKVGQKVDEQTRLAGARTALEQLTQARAAIDVAGEKAALDTANARVKTAQNDLAAAKKAEALARATVEKELRTQEDRDNAKTNAAAAADAAQRQQQAQDAWNQYYASQGGGGDPGFGDGGFGPDWQDSSWASTDPDADLGVPDYLDEPDLQELADLYGDEDEARKMAYLNDEPILGDTRASPYSLDRYYEGYDLDETAVFGVDTGTLVGGIIAGVLAAAPAVINAVAPPPSKDASSADTNIGASGKLTDAGGQGSSTPSSSSPFNVDTLLEKIGLKKTINDAAASAGSSAGKQGGDTLNSSISGYLVAGVALGLIVWAVKS